MKQRARLEDLGRIYEIISQIIDNEFFENLQSIRDYESWIKKHFPSYKCEEESILNAHFYDIHMKLRHLREKLQKIWLISKGENDE